MFEQKDVSRDETMLIVTSPLSGEKTAEFHRHMDELVTAGSRVITLDLSKAESINSSALGKILLFRKKLAEQDRVLQIRGCSDSLYKTFQMIKFDTLISIQR
jgi:anti-anti-sigma regulatory factor